LTGNALDQIEDDGENRSDNDIHSESDNSSAESEDRVKIGDKLFDDHIGKSKSGGSGSRMDSINAIK